jgi:hypothetical protein
MKISDFNKNATIKTTISPIQLKLFGNSAK